MKDIPTRLRTTMQSIDTARFQNDQLADRITDISHARAEILTALLFGHEIVVPAGAIADCPALIELIPEVFKDADPYLQSINKSFGIPYKLFRIALEPKYLNSSGFSGYRAYVMDYLKTKLNQEPPLVALIELARNSNWDSNYLTATMGRAYVDANWNAFDQIGGEIYEITNDTNDAFKIDMYKNYCMTISKYLDFEENAALPLYSESDFISDADESLYFNSLNDLIELQRRKGINLEDLDRESKVVSALFKEIKDNNLNPAERGSWYKQETRFKDEGMWFFVRNWLDNALYNELNEGFGVHLPSYFTQELDPLAEKDVSKTLTMMPDFSYGNASTDSNPDFPDELEVNWKDIWQIISGNAYQKSLNDMNFNFITALQEEKVEIAQSQNLPNEKKVEKMRTIREKRKNAMNLAFDRHIDFLNGELINFKITRKKNGKVVVNKSINPTEVKKRLVKYVIKASTLPVDIGLETISLIQSTLGEKTIDKTISEVYEKTASRLIGKAFKSNSPTQVDLIARPNNIEVVDTEAFIEASKNRINFSLTL